MFINCICKGILLSVISQPVLLKRVISTNELNCMQSGYLAVYTAIFQLFIRECGDKLISKIL